MAIQIQLNPGYLVLRTDSPTFRDPDAKECIAAIKAQNPLPEKIIFDFSCVDELVPSALRALTIALSPMSQSESKAAVVVQSAIAKFITDQGLNRIFPCYGSIKEIIGNPPSAADTRNQATELLNTILEAVSYTFQVTVSSAAKPGKTFIRGKTPGEAPQAQIGATVGLFSIPFTGSLILAFPTDTFLKIMARLIGEEHKEITADIQDGAAELLNIILGQAKTVLNEKGYALKQAIPTVVRGDNMALTPSSANPSIVIPFSSDVGDFYVELTTGPAARQTT